MTGVNVTETSALRVTAVYACVRVLAETVATLPLVVYRRQKPRGKLRDPSHPLYTVLHDQANTEMTAMQLRETMMAHVLLWGNAYASIERDGAGNVVGLWPLLPDRTYVVRDDKTGKLVYITTLPNGEQVLLPWDQVLHIPGLSYNGIVGYSPIQCAREAIGLALAAEEFGARFFGNGARPGGVLEHPATLSDEAYKRLRSSWESMHRGLNNAQRLAILEEGMQYKPLTIPPEDAQFLETRKFQVTEICRLFRVPPHLVGDLERATFSNIEHQSIEFVVHTIRPWLVRWEQAINMKLLTPLERRRFFVEHIVDGLLRGDIASRYNAYAIARQNGWMSANDIRELENMNPIPGGDVYLVPLNMQDAAVLEGGENNGTTGSNSAAQNGND